MNVSIQPIGRVSSPRNEVIDDDWESIISTVVLDPERVTPDAILGLTDFSHIDIVYVFDRVDPSQVQTGARHPRGNEAWPRVGILAQRAKNRPNRIGVTTCRLLDADGLTLTVQGLDAIDGTPVFDVKPYMTAFGPRGEVRQPNWVAELMTDYWTA